MVGTKHFVGTFETHFLGHIDPGCSSTLASDFTASCEPACTCEKILTLERREQFSLFIVCSASSMGLNHKSSLCAYI